MPVVETTPPVVAEPVQLGVAVEFLPQHAALRARGASGGVDVDPFHRRQVDHQAAVDRRPPRDVVAAAADRDVEVQRARQLDGVGDVRHALAARDQRRPFVDEAVVDAAHLVVAGIGRLKKLAGKGRRDLIERCGHRHVDLRWGGRRFYVAIYDCRKHANRHRPRRHQDRRDRDRRRREASGCGGGSRRRAATTTSTLDAVVGLVRDIEQTPARRGTVGVGIPGTISPATGLIKNANSTWLNGRPLADDLSRLLDRPVRFANDANCFALSEATDGAAAGADVVFGVIVGTGTGGGVVIDRRVLVGRERDRRRVGTQPAAGRRAATSRRGRRATADGAAASRRFCRARRWRATTPERRRRA